MTRGGQRCPILLLCMSVLEGLQSGTALAGMPTVALSDLAALRIEILSFFLLLYLGSTLGLQRLWNGLHEQVPQLPTLTFSRALMASSLLCLLLLTLLSIVSGTRELLTPGAWEKHGMTYRLAGDASLSQPNVSLQEQVDHQRAKALGRLRDALVLYASRHENTLPRQELDPEISTEIWQIPHPSALPYVYRPGRTLDEGHLPLAWEPAIYGGERFVLFADGAIERISVKELRQHLERAP